MIGVKRRDRRRNGKIRKMVGVPKEVNEVTNESMMRWNDCMKKIKENRMVKSVWQ